MIESRRAPKQFVAPFPRLSLTRLAALVAHGAAAGPSDPEVETRQMRRARERQSVQMIEANRERVLGGLARR